MPVSLAVQDLRKRFTLHIRGGLAIEALAAVSFDVHRGEFLGLVGASGSGKSTLLKCLFRTYLPDAGVAWFTLPGSDAMDLASASEHDILRLRAATVGYASQFLRVLPRVTAERTVAAPLAALGIESTEAVRRARTLLARLNVNEQVWDSFPVLLSGGEQQRVNLARALVTEPALLLLDEPTSALDASNQTAVAGLLEERLAAGTTIVGAFHDAPLLERLAGRTAHLSNGRLTAIATRSESTSLVTANG